MHKCSIPLYLVFTYQFTSSHTHALTTPQLQAWSLVVEEEKNFVPQHGRTVFRQRGSQQRRDAYEQREKKFVRDVRFHRGEEIERVAEKRKRVSTR